uniref:Uncharacterized protein n=1 Tax=Iconisemion striatum TaxID=60296 RepID=A0A1A7XKX0_9TELE
MGNRFSRRRDAPASGAGTVVAEQKAEAGPATPKQTEDSMGTQTQGETENLEVMAPEASSPKDDCVGSTDGAESEPTEKEPPVSAFKIPDPEDLAQPEVIFDPVSVFESEPPSHPEADAELISEPVPTPAESLEQPKDLLNQESVLSSPPLIDLGVPDVASSPTPISASLCPDESSDVSGSEQCEIGSSMLEPEKHTGMTEFLDKPMEAEAAECLEMPVSDVNQENLSTILKSSELKGSDFLNDLIESEVNIPEDTPITDLSSSIELM